MLRPGATDTSTISTVRRFGTFGLRPAPSRLPPRDILRSDDRKLRIAADYCNTLKHAGLNWKGRNNGQVETVNTHLKLDFTPKGFVGSAQVEIIMGGKRYNAYKLATDCVAAWHAFFSQNAIVIKQP
jgi:hypothetical protein